ncbi:MAG: hypothetical protein NTX82_00400 [Candidatus Parcubacteria bacterium]|nr:hypothetical protein [Candidatus Parcubacteria bacterium]
MTWEQFYPQLANDMERAEMVKLFLLGQQGSYSDLVLMALDEYLVLYDRQIKSATSNQQRQRYFKKELEGLAYIFTTLNYQVRTYQVFDAQSKKDFATYLGHAPVSEEDWRQWSSFLYAYPQYQVAPGFWSYTLESNRGSRSWDNYFQHELLQVQTELKELPAEVAVVYYQSVLKNFSGVLQNNLVK